MTAANQLVVGVMFAVSAYVSWTTASDLRHLRILRAEIATAPGLVTETQELGADITVLHGIESNPATLQFLVDPEAHVRAILSDQNVRMADFELYTEIEGARVRHVVVKALAGIPNLGNCLYLLHSKTHRLTISDLQVERSDGRWALSMRIPYPDPR